MDNENKKDSFVETGHDLSDKVEDPFIEFLHKIIRVAVKVLAALMVLVIVWNGEDVEAVSMRTIVHKLKTKLKSGMIINLRGVGYKLLGQ